MNIKELFATALMTLGLLASNATGHGSTSVATSAQWSLSHVWQPCRPATNLLERNLDSASRAWFKHEKTRRKLKTAEQRDVLDGANLYGSPLVTVQKAASGSDRW